MGKYRRTPSIFQMEMTECGAASLCMVLAYYGCHIPLEEMRVEAGVSRDGCNMKGIKRAANRYGLKARAFRKEPEDLRKMNTPCIIHWNFNHFVVFEGFKGHHAYINDPAVGRRKLTCEELDESFTGIVMTFEQTDEFKKTKKKSTILSFVASRLKGQYGVLLQLLYVGLLLVFPGLILPVLSQVFIDDVLGNGYRDWLTRLLVFMGGCVLLKAMLSYYRTIVLEKLKTKMTLLSGRDFLLHMFRLPASFFDQRYTGDLVSRMMNNAEINNFLAGDLTESVLNIITACFYLVILILYSPIMTLVGSLKVIICIIAMMMSAHSLMDVTMKLQMSSGRVNGAISAGLSITDSIKASGVEKEYAASILGHYAKYANLEQELTRRQQILTMIPDTAGKIVDVLLLLLGGLMVIRGQMTMGMLVAYNSLYDSFCEPVDKLVGFFRSLQQLRSNIGRIEDIEKHQQDIRFCENIKTSSVSGKLQGNVELRGISFGYSQIQPPVVEGFEMMLSSGESIAFVGPSGCGKSTITKVISGLYCQWEGEVLFDGIPLREIPSHVFYNSVSIVSQDIQMFSGTIRDNLTMWDPTINEEDLIFAAKDACIYDFIMQQPGGFDARLEEGARNVSGGQRQRLEIARALAKKPTILLMDEATSALDPLVEKKILDNIRRRGCTCIMVAHRLSAIRDCSKIVVMRGGKIVECGTHRKLMEMKGFYASLISEESAKAPVI